MVLFLVSTVCSSLALGPGTFLYAQPNIANLPGMDISQDTILDNNPPPANETVPCNPDVQPCEPPSAATQGQPDTTANPSADLAPSANLGSAGQEAAINTIESAVPDNSITTSKIRDHAVKLSKLGDDIGIHPNTIHRFAQGSANWAESGTATALCQPGETVLGGGVMLAAVDSTPTDRAADIQHQELMLISSIPVLQEGVEGWTVEAFNHDQLQEDSSEHHPWTFTAYAVCATFTLGEAPARPAPVVIK